MLDAISNGDAGVEAALETHLANQGIVDTVTIPHSLFTYGESYTIKVTF